MSKRSPTVRDVAARNALVVQWSGLPKFVWHKYLCHDPVARRMGADDLLQEGMLGLIRAAELWREGEDAKFVTYATKCVWSRMRQAIERKLTLIHAPGKTTYTADAATSRQTLSLEKIDPSRIRRTGGGDGLAAAMANDEKRWLDDLLWELPRRERFIIRAVVGRGRTLAWTAGKLGCTRERVRQIKLQAMARLREMAGSRA